MDGSNLEAAPAQATTSPAYKDRSTGLTVFGVFTMLLGAVFALFVSLSLIGLMAAARANMPQNTVRVLPIVIFYGGLAIALIWLGIGSIMARRWARALLLIFSWTWLVVGMIGTASVALVIPQMLAQQAAATRGSTGVAVAPVPMGTVLTITLLFMGVFLILLPLIWIYFYKSPHVKATCEARDAKTRWTDACPLPVLAASLWLLVAVPMMLLMPIAGRGVMPFFGMFLTGLPGSIFCLVMAALWAYAAWLLYKLNVRGWWLVLITFLAMLVSGLLTYARHDMIEVYQLMGYPDEQIDQLQKSGLLTGHRMNWLMAFCMVPWLGYIFYIKRYFRAKAEALSIQQ